MAFVVCKFNFNVHELHILCLADFVAGFIYECIWQCVHKNGNCMYRLLSVCLHLRFINATEKQVNRSRWYIVTNDLADSTINGFPFYFSFILFFHWYDFLSSFADCRSNFNESQFFFFFFSFFYRQKQQSPSRWILVWTKTNEVTFSSVNLPYKKKTKTKIDLKRIECAIFVRFKWTFRVSRFVICCRL